MNEFKESLIVSRESSGRIIITKRLENLLIELMKGNISKNKLMELTDIGDKATVEKKLQEVVLQNPNLSLLYEEYVSRKNTDFEGYNFRAEAIEMLRKDYSQSFMASKIGVNRRSYSTKMKKLEKENKDNILGILLTKHADRKMMRQKISIIELAKINVELDQYEKEFPVGLAKYEKRSPLEVKLENISRIISTIDELELQGYSLKELSERGVISESTYRKYKEEAINLSKILGSKSREEE